MNQPFNQLPKPTTAQLWLAHTLFIIAIAAAVTSGIAVYGAFVSGNHDWAVLAAIALTAAGAVVAKGWSDKIQGKAELWQALSDTWNAYIAAQAPTVMPIPVQPASPLVVIHTTTMPDIQQPTQPPVRVPAPFTLPQKPSPEWQAVSSLLNTTAPPQPSAPPQLQQAGNAQGWPPLQSVPQGDGTPQPLPLSTPPDVPVPAEEDGMIERNWNPSGMLPVVQPGQ